MINDVERRTRLAPLRVYDKALAWNRGIRVVLPLLLLKNILQNTQHGKTVKERSRFSFEPYDSEASSDTDSTNESDEEQFERLQKTDL